MDEFLYQDEIQHDRYSTISRLIRPVHEICGANSLLYHRLVRALKAGDLESLKKGLEAFDRQPARLRAEIYRRMD
ncbi:MAG: hypothetical protein ACFB3T_09465 [Geminicoccaceae bacterium]